jgi:hypothetical protein
MTLSALGIFSAAGAGGGLALSDFELISSTILGSATSSITFDVSTLASTYKHLQIRMLARKDGANGQITMTMNGSGLSYGHELTGTGSSVISSAQSGNATIGVGLYTSPFLASNFGVTLLDLLDPFSSTKNKTVRILGGYVDPVESRIWLRSGLWNSTATVTSIVINSTATNFTSGSRFSLYGIKG